MEVENGNLSAVEFNGVRCFSFLWWSSTMCNQDGFLWVVVVVEFNGGVQSLSLCGGVQRSSMLDEFVDPQHAEESFISYVVVGIHCLRLASFSQVLISMVHWQTSGVISIAWEQSKNGMRSSASLPSVLSL